MLEKTSFSSAFLSVLLVLGLSATVAGGDENALSTVKRRRDVSYRSVVNQPDLLTMLYVGAGDDWFVTVIRKPQLGGLPQYHMSFFRKIKGGLFRKLYEYKTVDRFQAAYSPIERDRLFTVWTTGSAHRLRVFSVSERAIKEVLSAGWKRDPEFVHLTEDNELEIVIPSDELADQAPKLAEVYQWNGKAYTLVDKLPWAERLRELKGAGASK